MSSGQMTLLHAMLSAVRVMNVINGGMDTGCNYTQLCNETSFSRLPGDDWQALP
jgi:hypothetical protein